MNITRLRPLRPATTSSLASSRRAAEPCKIEFEAFALLAEILARLHGMELPVVQFMPAGRSGSGGHVSQAFAAAAAARFGRTLLLDDSTRHESFGRASGPRASGRKQRRPLAVVPDADIAGLYHRRASDASLDLIAAETPDAQPFKMIVVQSAMPCMCPSSLDRARQCHGSVLTVAAGVTPLPELQATARQLGHAGGKLLGLVLFDAPAIWLPFGRRPAA